MTDSKAGVVRRGFVTAARTLAVAGIVAVLSLSQAGCSSDSSGAPKYRGMPAGCPQVIGVAKVAIRQFAGELFSEALEFESPGAQSADPSRSTLECRMRYPDRRGSGVSAALGAPATRAVNVTLVVGAGDRAVDNMRGYIVAASESAGGRPVAGLGDQAYSGVTPFSGREAAETGFRIGNAVVTVSVSGTDVTGPASATSPVPLADLGIRATEIARVFAGDLDDLLPH
ncbi:hypothetical protein [Nocardia bovistercoris]|uniref:DUF3558 domain-containing protein n=1 Tax=Nocardia bovistercoris TaxID=2785916 RepID=A0A931I7Z7_9NOCA|nr:hypothetical protein [Nocardia bovistercoris]MBH0775068.1 hypothetical protein [Nocardia bovistercoris]